jgi:hypothetical protein
MCKWSSLDDFSFEDTLHGFAKGDLGTMLKRFSIFLSVLVLVSVAFTATAAEKVLLQYTPAPGTTAKYKMNIRGNTIVTAYRRAQRTNLETAMTIEQKVTGVDRQGNIDMATTILDGTITVNNTPTQLPNTGSIINVKMAKDGEIISSSGMDQQGNFNQMQIRFPKKPVGVGDNWSSTIQPNPQLPIPMNVKYTVMGFEKRDGFDCVKLKSEVTSSQGSAGSINLDVKANGMIWFAHKKGIMVQNEVTSNMIMIMENDLGGGKKEKIETRMNLNLKMGLTK